MFGVAFASCPISLVSHERSNPSPLAFGNPLSIVRPVQFRSSFVERACRPVRTKPVCVPQQRVKCIAQPVVQSIVKVVDPSMVSVAVGATVRLFVTTMIGVLAATRGLLDKNTLQALSKTVFAIFLPSMLLTNVATTLASGAGAELMWLPFAAVAQVAIGMLVGFLGSRALRLRPSESRVYLVCCAFGNSAALPLLFANSLFNAPAQLAGMVSGISFYLLGWSGLFWALGYQLLATLPSDSASEATETAKKPNVSQIFSRIFSPPLIASLIGLFIGCLSPPLRNLVIASPIFAALRTLGAGYSPTAVLVLAGSLARRIEKPANGGDVDSAAAGLRIGRMSIGIVLTRFLLMPILGLLMVTYGRHTFFKTPMVRFVLLLQCVMPPAQNSTLILNMEGKQDAATSVARLLLSIYTFGIIPISIGLSIFLSVAGF